MPKNATKQNADVVAVIDVQIQAVIAEIDAQLELLENKKATLVSLIGQADGLRRGRPASSKAPVTGANDKSEKKRVVSAATKAKLKEAAQARWARQREEKAKAEKAKKAA